MTEGDEALGLSNIRAADVASLSETDEPCRIHKDLQITGRNYGGFNAVQVLVQQAAPFLWEQSPCMACRRECIELFASNARPIVEHRTE